VAFSTGAAHWHRAPRRRPSNRPSNK
jgi:hypothetical protein